MLDRRVPDRRILKKFPRSQHRPSLIVPPRVALPVPSKPVERWNLRKVNWSHYNTLTSTLAKSLLSPDSPDVDLAYQDFCNVIRTAAKWSKAIQTIDFSHSSQQAWSISNNLTGRTRRSPRHCALSANAIASQLIRNSRYKGIDRESSRLISQEVSDLWRAASTSQVNVSESFTSQESAAARKHLKPRKTSGSNSICSDLKPHAGAALKSWLCGFLSSSLRRLKIPKVWRRALLVVIPKPKKACRQPEKLSSHLLALRPLQDPRQAHTHLYNYEKELVKS